MKTKQFRIKLFKSDKIADQIAIIAATENGKGSVTQMAIISYLAAQQVINKDAMITYSWETKDSFSRLYKWEDLLLELQEVDLCDLNTAREIENDAFNENHLVEHLPIEMYENNNIDDLKDVL